jgi:hypothetical protein
MADFVRITATCVSDSERQPDPGWRIVLIALVQGGHLISGEFFGKALEGQYGSWPFSLEPPEGSEGMGRFYFGPGFKGPKENTNLFTKSIKVGEVFTRWYYGKDEWTYQITHVHQIS